MLVYLNVAEQTMKTKREGRVKKIENTEKQRERKLKQCDSGFPVSSLSSTTFQAKHKSLSHFYPLISIESGLSQSGRYLRELWGKFHQLGARRY